MKYYKIIQNDSVIGVCSSDDFRIYQEKNGLLLFATEKKGQYIRLGNILFRDDWMSPINETANIDFEHVTILRISKNEYDILKQAEESGNEIVLEQLDEEQQDEVQTLTDPITEMTIEYVKTLKIKEMSAVCNHTITNGFDITLSDNHVHHFSLTTQDQLNFISLSSMIANGETQIPYHADGELCKFYSVSDMNKVIETATNFKTYHVTYFNALRNYIQSLETIEDVANIEYGVSIPEQYQSEVLISLIANAQNY